MDASACCSQGFYGTISYVVNEQRREIAIRLAWGVQRGNILRIVLRRGAGLTAAGTGLGVVGALIVSHLMSRSALRRVAIMTAARTVQNALAIQIKTAKPPAV
ncbi:FtsX-like permease family protein [Terriglobus albidus]|uniref:FtsX-like permease family protein n=1 Tax=Terriglobus albidus TaxID=1592106 RepID=UPI00164EA878|nr:FtsX-like permease family protein [Terriglobus albidus]